MSTRQRPAAVLLAAALAVLAACGRLTPPGGGTGDTGQGGPAGEAPPAAANVQWEAVGEQLPEPVRRWLRPRLDQVGIDQTRHGDRVFVAVTWGRRPNAGYRAHIREVRAAGDTLLLAVELITPPADAPAAPQPTRPHAVVAVRPAAAYRLAPVFLGAHFLQNAAFEVLEPMPFTPVAGAVRLRGRARVFEANFLVRVEDTAGVLLEQPVMASEGAPGWGTFDVRLALPRTPRGDQGRVVLFEPSAEDGSPLHTVVIPVRFQGAGEP